MTFEGETFLILIEGCFVFFISVSCHCFFFGSREIYSVNYVKPKRDFTNLTSHILDVTPQQI